jgi:single-strand DNA-binding protein
MNIIQVAGHLGADPVTRFTPTGQKVTTFNVAVNGRKGGNEVTTWFRITVWGDRFDKMLTYLKKGSAVIIIGELQKPEIWTDKEGRPQVSLDITADIIKFSPFGKPDRTDGPSTSNHSTSSQSNYNSYNNSREGSGSSFGEPSFSGGHGGGSQQGYKQQNQNEETEMEEDKVPF